MTEQADAGGRARVLIVDDEPMNVDLLEQERELLGHDTVGARDGREALDVLARTPVDLVLLDIMMPQLDGYDVLRRIKADAGLRHLPVIMISALDQLASVVRCIELGAEDYLPKPFEPVLLAARVGACLDKKRLHDREAAHLRRIEEQLRIIERERERSDRLLHAILPAPAVAELKATARVTPRRHEDVAVLFADLVAFTAWCETHAPEQVVADLDRLARDCEALVDGHGLEKIKTLGDGFLATGNLLEPLADPVLASVRCAAAMQAAAAASPAGWRLRAGIHVGPVVAGVVGRSKFSFDLWGDTVNVAARLAALGSEAAIYLSGEAWERTAGRCRCTPLGPIELRGGRRVVVYRCEDTACR
jgi:adenylate cyclase